MSALPSLLSTVRAGMTVDMNEFIFDPRVLEEVDFSSAEDSFNPRINVLNPGEGLLLRPLKKSDYQTGFLDCLKQLTTVGDVKKDQFEDTFEKMKASRSMYYVIVVEEKSSGRVIASGTLFLEQKFIHDCGLRGRIEDIVVDSAHRSKQLGKLLILTLKLLSKHLDCYKVTLDCTDTRRGFYEKLGFKREEGNSNFMQIRFR